MMPKHDQVITDAVLSEAAEWFATLEDESVTEEQRDNWLNWLNQSSEHQLAWQQIKDITTSFDGIKQDAISKHVVRGELSRPFFSNKTSILSLLLVGIVSVMSIYLLSPFPSSHNLTTYQTAVGESQAITLDDGSRLWLNTNTTVTTNFSDDVRLFSLQQGEIFIETGADKAHHHRSLIVKTKDGQLTALGTRFNVHQTSSETQLDVFEGAVRIEPTKSELDYVIVAGNQSHFDQHAILSSGNQAAVNNESWTKGIVTADDTPLCDFMHNLERYQTQSIVCPNELNQYTLVGTYPLKQPEAIFTAIENSLPVQIWQVTDSVWRVDKRQ
ncbi:MAG TPA: DUF4880 domain-containing protein [Methylophaga aminisulfidivorans]|uniref:DUF4880 domain-containing protein n=1 Tax=Methylophaga aminisulfidivorans TaxID=230105 RepID=A0A7C1W4L7_9GAMM|nr:DUF4880 domain-containing protein [Methylophaga aminisulfidivorans]